MFEYTVHVHIKTTIKSSFSAWETIFLKDKTTYLTTLPTNKNLTSERAKSSHKTTELRVQFVAYMLAYNY